MAERDIYLNLEQLNTSLISMNNQKIKDIEQAMRCAFTAVSRLTLNGWEGESKDSFVKKFEDYKKEIQAFTVSLKDFNSQLKNILKNGKQLNSQSSKISAKL
jgi:uncharacterized protein YukE